MERWVLSPVLYGDLSYIPIGGWIPELFPIFAVLFFLWGYLETPRVNMPPTKHHPVTEHPYCADQCRWMNALIFKSILKLPYNRTPDVEKMCSAFLHFTPGHLILVYNFGHWKVHFQDNCLQFWVWVNTFLEKMLCVEVWW